MTRPRRTPLVAVGTVTALVAGLAATQLLPGASPTASAAGLVPWADCDELLAHYRSELVRSTTAWGGGGPEVMGVGAATSTGAVAESARAGAPLAASAADAGSATGGPVGAGATGTNLQEQGVDEPDKAKLVDGRLLVLSGGRLQVLSAGRQPRLSGSTLLGPPETSYGGELLVAGDRALVVLQGWRQTGPVAGGGSGGPAVSGPAVTAPAMEPAPVEDMPIIGGETRESGGTDQAPADKPTDAAPDAAPVEPAPDAAPDAAPVEPAPDARTGAGMIMVAPGTPTTRTLLLDISGDTPRLLEEATLDGQYVSARLVGDTVRLVTTSRPQVPMGYPQASGRAAEDAALRANRAAAGSVALPAVLPQLRRVDAAGAVLEEGPAVPCTATSRAVGAAGAATLLVTTLQPARGLAAVDRDAVTTDGDLVYASAERLYVATSRWGTTAQPVDDTVSGLDSRAAPDDEVTTELHGFDVSTPASTAYLGTGSVPGYVYGRWALSAHEGALRVATTRQPPWRGETTTAASSSMVVVLAERDGALTETGRVEGLGVTEQIKSVRYFGDLAAVVTFRQTDPLYLLDLGGTPRVLGELKVPGFSTYLHPLGDDLLLGLGYDATEEGRVTGVQASVFDVSDPAKPTLVSRLPLGQGYSPALDDSRAFAYDPARRLAVLPFSSHDDKGIAPPAGGIVGIAVAADGTLSEAGRLAEPATGAQAERVLLDDQSLYAVAEGQVVAVDPTGYAVTQRVDLAG